MTEQTVGEIAAVESLRVVFPPNATVSVVITDHRRNRRGQSQTTLVALGTLDGRTVNVSGWVASATGYGRTSAAGMDSEDTRVIVKGVGNPNGAAGVLVSELATAIHGVEHALNLAIL